jgi:DNA-binding PadR family transcriptional regulator
MGLGLMNVKPNHGYDINQVVNQVNNTQRKEKRK